MKQKLKEHTKSKSQFFEKVNNTDKPLAKVTKRKRTKIRIKVIYNKPTTNIISQ